MYIISVIGIRSKGKSLSGTRFYRSLTLDQPASDLTDFPVLFTGTFTYLKTVANGGKVQHGSGYDITFYADAALTTLLKFERVSWDATTGTCEFWIKVPTLTSASAKVIYLSYGSTAITTDQQDAANTWNTSYKMVCHFPNGSSLTTNDSTGNGNNGTNSGASAVGGQIDGAAEFVAGQSDKMTWSGLVIPTTGTLSFWWNPQQAISTYSPIFVSRPSLGTLKSFEVSIFGSTMYGGWYNNGNDDRVTWAVSGISQGTFYYVTLTWTNGGTTELRVNNVSEATGSSLDATFDSSGQNSYLNLDPYTANFYNSMYNDELRLSDSVRNTDWIAAELSNQSDPANFYIIGAETPA